MKVTSIVKFAFVRGRTRFRVNFSFSLRCTRARTARNQKHNILHHFFYSASRKLSFPIRLVYFKVFWLRWNIGKNIFTLYFRFCSISQLFMFLNEKSRNSIRWKKKSNSWVVFFFIFIAHHKLSPWEYLMRTQRLGKRRKKKKSRKANFHGTWTRSGSQSFYVFLSLSEENSCVHIGTLVPSGENGLLMTRDDVKFDVSCDIVRTGLATPTCCVSYAILFPSFSCLSLLTTVAFARRRLKTEIRG